MEHAHFIAHIASAKYVLMRRISGAATAPHSYISRRVPIEVLVYGHISMPTQAHCEYGTRGERITIPHALPSRLSSIAMLHGITKHNKYRFQQTLERKPHIARHHSTRWRKQRARHLVQYMSGFIAAVARLCIG